MTNTAAVSGRYLNSKIILKASSYQVRNIMAGKIPNWMCFKRHAGISLYSSPVRVVRRAQALGAGSYPALHCCLMLR